MSIQFRPNTSLFTEQIIQKKKDLEEERAARAKLEERVAQLESEHVTKENKNEVTEEDKSIAVIDGVLLSICAISQVVACNVGR